jgi:uncharacterized membrane protein YgaE (UPF0421/DUF939 family)
MFAGARIFKTGLAVAMSMFICDYFNIQPALFAGAATVLNMQPSVRQSIFNAREQLAVHFLSIAIAIILGLSLGPHPLVMGLSTIIIIYTCNKLKLRSAISGGVMASIFILNAPEAQFINHATVRSLAIFIGLGVALAVNFTIAPPRYRQPLVRKLTELNSVINEVFRNAVNSFLELNPPSAGEQEQKKKQVEQLLKEANNLFDRYRYGTEPFFDSQPALKEKETQLFRDYLTYNKGLWQRSKDILFLAQDRIERRKEAGDLPISKEFQEIIQILNNALELYLHHNAMLLRKLEGEEPEVPEEPHIWSQLDMILNRWHDRFPSGSYYLHALVEVSLITYKIRWAAKESARLLGE